MFYVNSGNQFLVCNAEMTANKAVTFYVLDNL